MSVEKWHLRCTPPFRPKLVRSADETVSFAAFIYGWWFPQEKDAREAAGELTGSWPGFRFEAYRDDTK